jgi:hypothetical protein
MVVAFHQLLGSGLVVTVALDRLRDERADGGPVIVPPDRVHILPMSCHRGRVQLAFAGFDS